MKFTGMHSNIYANIIFIGLGENIPKHSILLKYMYSYYLNICNFYDVTMN